jgi:Zn-dependent peptidase ImmA (M78 family)
MIRADIFTVEVVPAYKLGEDTSGLTTYHEGQYLIAVNKNRSRTHRRFTCAMS